MKDEIDKRWHDLGEFIREQRNVGQMSLRKLSELAGVSNPYLSQIERGLRKPSAEILQQIARALEISSETLYVRAGILDEPLPPQLAATLRGAAPARRSPWLAIAAALVAGAPPETIDASLTAFSSGRTAR